MTEFLNQILADVGPFVSIVLVLALMAVAFKIIDWMD